DERVLYVIDKNRGIYFEVPMAPGKDQGKQAATDTIHLERTGKSRKVANYSCEEYRGSGAIDVGKVTVSACVSKNAPGADEVAKFERRMLSQMSGDAKASSPDDS